MSKIVQSNKIKMSKRNLFVTESRIETRIKLIPPDGGWGWMVLLGIAIANFFNQSMLSIFSLLNDDAFESTGHEMSGAAIVLSSMLFVSNFGGPIAGAIIKLTSPRFVAVFGAICCTCGIFFSGFSTSIYHLMLTGVLFRLGVGFIQKSSLVSINSYFKERKRIAVGLAIAGTGVGQMLMPHVVRYLLEEYGFMAACIILGALSLHGICGTMLLQPVAWHMKKVKEEVIVDKKVYLLQESNNISENNKEQSDTVDGTNKNGRQPTEPFVKTYDIQSYKKLPTCKVSQNEKFIGDTKQTVRGKTLFRFLNIIIGTALTVVSVQNFNLLFPLFLQKTVSLNKQQTAYCMSAVALVDIVGRIILPMFQSRFKISARMMLVLISIWTIVVRQIIASQSHLYVLLVLSGIYGFGKSMIILARNIAILEQCRMDQVPSTVSMLTTGFIILSAGWFLRWIRDYTNNYVICITAQNLLLVIFLIMWIPDMLYSHHQGKKRKAKVEALA